MNKGLLIGGGVAALAFVQYRDFELFRDNLTFKVPHVKLLLAQTNLQQIAFQAQIDIINPRNYHVTAQSMQLIIASNGKPIGNVYRPTPFEIKPNATTSLNVTFAIPFNTSIPAVVALFQNFFNELTLNLELAGLIRFQLLDVKFATNFKII